MAKQSVQDLSGELVVQAARLVRAARHRTGDALPAGIRVLSLLDQYGALGVGRLAELDRCSQPTMTGTVKALVERAVGGQGAGPHRRPRHPRDARPPAGTAALTDVRRRNADAVAERFAAQTLHSPEDLATAVSVLRAVLETTPDHEKGTL